MNLSGSRWEVDARLEREGDIATAVISERRDGVEIRGYTSRQLAQCRYMSGVGGRPEGPDDVQNGTFDPTRTFIETISPLPSRVSSRM